MGDPCVVVNGNVSWKRYAAVYTLERFPEIFDRMEARGAATDQVDALRASHVPALAQSLGDLYLGAQHEHLALFSMARLVRRFGHLPQFQRAWPTLEALYGRAFALGAVEDPSLPPERLAAIADDARRSSVGARLQRVAEDVRR